MNENSFVVSPSSGLTRRDLMKGAAALAVGTAASAATAVTANGMSAPAAAQAAATPWDAPLSTVVASPSKNVVEIESGKIYGYLHDGVLAFMGIPYGASTEGKNRFMPPQKPEPWAGVRPAIYWGPVAPQNFTSTLDAPRAGWKHPRESFMFRWEDGHDGEDCLVANVWTRSLDSTAKRPVMVWIHGGGFVGGSDQELRMYPGDNLVRRGDVVVVSVNHRLGALGFANLQEYGDQYGSSQNVGMLDLVQALQWVKTNVERFGGDPNRVLVFGQSGGGRKISNLMGMPAAEGLFHRAVVESGSALTALPLDHTARTTAAMVAALGLSKATIGKIHEIPYQSIIQAAEHSQKVGAAFGVPGTGALGWGPTVDGTVLPRNPWDPTAPTFSAHVPMIVGTVLNEFYNSVQMEDPSVDGWDLSEVRRQLSKPAPAGFGAATDHLIAVSRKVYPHAEPFFYYSILMATRRERLFALTQVELKARQAAAPAYNYWFQRQAPILDGKGRAHHCSELPFVFYQTETCATMTGGGADARALGGRMADAWIEFARSGNPNHAGLPQWPAYDPATVPTMIFDDRCEVKNDPDGEIRRALIAAVKA